MALASKCVSPLVLKRVNIKSFFQTSQTKAIFNESHNSKNQKGYATEVNINDLPPPAKFIKLSEGTMEDFKAAQEHFSKVASTKNTVDRWINMIEVLYIGRFKYFLVNFLKKFYNPNKKLKHSFVKFRH